MLTAGNDAGAKQIKNLANATLAQDAVTLSQLGAATAALDLDAVLTNGNDAGAQQIKNLANATLAQDAVTLSQLGAAWAALNLQAVLTNGNDAGALPILNVQDGATPQSAATVTQAEKSVALSTRCNAVFAGAITGYLPPFGLYTSFIVTETDAAMFLGALKNSGFSKIGCLINFTAGNIGDTITVTLYLNGAPTAFPVVFTKTANGAELLRDVQIPAANSGFNADDILSFEVVSSSALISLDSMAFFAD